LIAVLGYLRGNQYYITVRTFHKNWNLLNLILRLSVDSQNIEGCSI